jgi:protein-tyrosine phosphatase
MLTIDDWPAAEPTLILPGLWMGGLVDHEYLGAELTDAHYSFTSRFDLVVTLYADAQPAPWGVTELRYGFPDDDIPDHLITPCIPLAQHGWSAWRAGNDVLVRCQQGVNRSGLVTALILMLDGHTAADAIALLRDRRGAAVLNNPRFETWLLHRAATHLTPATTGDAHE